MKSRILSKFKIPPQNKVFSKRKDTMSSQNNIDKIIIKNMKNYENNKNVAKYEKRIII